MSFIDSMTVSANTATVRGKTERLADAIADCERENDAERARDERRTGLQDFVDFARDVEAANDPP